MFFGIMNHLFSHQIFCIGFLGIYLFECACVYVCAASDMVWVWSI